MLTKEQIRTPLWDTDTVWEESLMMLREEDGRAAAPLLYEPLEILSVTDSRGETVYEQGRDWVLEGRELCLTPDSRIFCFTRGQLYPTQGVPGESFAMPGGYVLFHEGAFFIDRQIAVTYRCRRGGWTGVVPRLAEDTLPRTLRLLRGGEPISIVLYGDSISEGANATLGLNIPPYQPDYGRMVYEALRDRYGDQIRYTNTSVGGRETNWAVDMVESEVNAYHPDLVIIGFGMNDVTKEPAHFEERIRTLIGLIRGKNPLCEFILIATTLPNPLLTDERAFFWGYQKDFGPRLEAIAADTPGVAVADITGMHRFLLSRKRFFDMTSNNVNHPNDFLYRCHLHYLSGMLIG